MSRREEISIHLASACEGCDDGMEHAAVLEEECRTLADEVDARDAVITKLLAMLKDNEPRRIHGVIYYTDAQNRQAELYTRACEIAGRAE